MKILLVSDTHGDKAALEALIERYANQVQLICHMGDHDGDLHTLQSRWSGVPKLIMTAVSGNCDYGGAFQKEQILKLYSRKVLLTHGHHQRVKSGLDRLGYYAKEKGMDTCFFGHTHVPVIQWVGGVFLMNPGSLCEPRGGSLGSYGLAEIFPNGEISGEIMYI